MFYKYKKPFTRLAHNMASFYIFSIFEDHTNYITSEVDVFFWNCLVNGEYSLNASELDALSLDKRGLTSIRVMFPYAKIEVYAATGNIVGKDLRIKPATLSLMQFLILDWANKEEKKYYDKKREELKMKLKDTQ